MNSSLKQELISNIKKSQKQVLFFLCALIISVLFSIYSYNELINTSKELQESYEDLQLSENSLSEKNNNLIEIQNLLKEQKEELIKSKNSLEENKTILNNSIEKYEASVNKYRAFIDVAIQSRDGDEVALSEYNRILENADNLKYNIGLFSKGLQDKELDNIVNQLVEQGYTITDHWNLNDWGDEIIDWVAKEPTVFYYDKLSKREATTIANQIKKLTAINFKVVRGAGLGVVDDLKRWTIYVHLIK